MVWSVFVHLYFKHRPHPDSQNINIGSPTSTDSMEQPEAATFQKQRSKQTRDQNKRKTYYSVSTCAWIGREPSSALSSPLLSSLGLTVVLCFKCAICATGAWRVAVVMCQKWGLDWEGLRLDELVIGDRLTDNIGVHLWWYSWSYLITYLAFFMPFQDDVCVRFRSCWWVVREQLFGCIAESVTADEERKREKSNGPQVTDLRVNFLCRFVDHNKNSAFEIEP